MEVAVITLQRTREQTQRETRGQPPGLMKEQTLLKTKEQPLPRIHKISYKRLKAMIESLKAELAEKSCPLTERMSMREGLMGSAQEMIAIHTQAKDMTELQLR